MFSFNMPVDCRLAGEPNCTLTESSVHIWWMIGKTHRDWKQESPKWCVFTGYYPHWPCSWYSSLYHAFAWKHIHIVKELLAEVNHMNNIDVSSYLQTAWCKVPRKRGTIWNVKLDLCVLFLFVIHKYILLDKDRWPHIWCQHAWRISNIVHN